MRRYLASDALHYLRRIPIPVSDVDRARAFCTEKVGFNVDLDVQFDTTADTT